MCNACMWLSKGDAGFGMIGGATELVSNHSELPLLEENKTYLSTYYSNLQSFPPNFVWIKETVMT